MIDDFSDDGYSSLDGGESYLDYDTRTDVSEVIDENLPIEDRTRVLEQPSQVVAEYNKVGFGQNSNIFIVGQKGANSGVVSTVSSKVNDFQVSSDDHYLSNSKSQAHESGQIHQGPNNRGTFKMNRDDDKDSYISDNDDT